MDEQTFWGLLDKSAEGAHGDLNVQIDALRGSLEGLSREEVVGFHERVTEMLARAYSWDLLGAAYFIGCGQSADGFMDFRAWLIAQGRRVFDAVLDDVNLLAQVAFRESPTEEWYCEELYSLSFEVLGEDDVDLAYPDDPGTPSGTPVELTRAALQERFPVLWSRFGSRFMIGA